jgi:hypothetical protein
MTFPWFVGLGAVTALADACWAWYRAGYARGLSADR